MLLSPRTNAEPDSPIGRGWRYEWLAFFAIIAVGGTVRLLSACNDLWLDEIWTWMTAIQLQAALDVLLRVRDENNHFLNTWFVYWIGPEASSVLYRLPNILAGTGSIWLAGLIARRHGLAEAMFSMTLVASSYLLVHYSSEARGYGLAVFFSLLAYWAMQRSFDRPSRLYEVTFAAAAILGVLSQPMFIYAYASLAAWWLWRCALTFREPRLRKKWLISGAYCHLVPVAFMAWLYFVNLRLMVNSGGPVYSMTAVVLQTLSLAVGGFWSGTGATTVAIVVAIAAMVGLIALRRAADDRWVLFACVIFVAPAALFLMTNRREIYPRYFVISVAFLCLLLGHGFALLWSRSRAGRFVAVLALTAILVGNGWHIARLIEVGRGQYLDALVWMQRQSEGPELHIGSDHAFRNGMLLSFYQRFLEKRVVYYPEGRWPPNGPEWLILHDLELDARFPSEFAPMGGLRYERMRVFPYAGLSGWQWGLYRRTAPSRP